MPNAAHFRIVAVSTSFAKFGVQLTNNGGSGATSSSSKHCAKLRNPSLNRLNSIALMYAFVSQAWLLTGAQLDTFIKVHVLVSESEWTNDINIGLEKTITLLSEQRSKGCLQFWALFQQVCNDVGSFITSSSRPGARIRHLSSHLHKYNIQ
jgi:hypothetical protein